MSNDASSAPTSPDHRLTVANELADAVAAAATKAGHAPVRPSDPKSFQAGWLIQEHPMPSGYGVRVLPHIDGLVTVSKQSDGATLLGELMPVPGLTYELLATNLQEGVRLVMVEVDRLIDAMRSKV